MTAVKRNGGPAGLDLSPEVFDGQNLDLLPVRRNDNEAEGGH